MSEYLPQNLSLIACQKPHPYSPGPGNERRVETQSLYS